MRSVLLYTAGFVVVGVLAFYPLYSNGLSMVEYIDGVGQYYPAFLYTGKWLRALIENLINLRMQVPVFDLSIGMGESVIGALNYYGLNDPLNILAVFANNQNGAYWFSAMYLLRIFLSGLSFMLYCRYMKLNPGWTVIGGLSYAYSGYALYGVAVYIEFSAPYIYFPLLLLGCEKVWKEQRLKCLLLTSVYACLCNIYFVYAAALFLVVYCLVRTTFLYRKNVGRALLECLKCGGVFLMGAVLSAPVTILFLQSLMWSARSELSIAQILLNPDNYIPSSHTIQHYLKGICPAVAYWSNIPVLVFLGGLVAVFRWRTPRQKQCALGVLLGSIGALVLITSYLFSGFGNCYDRWNYQLIFVFLVVFVVTAEELSKRFFGSGRTARRVKCVAGFLCAVNLSVGGAIIYSQCSYEFLPFEQIQKYTDSPVNYSQVIAADEDVFRISSDSLTNVNERPENVAMINDYYGLTYWLSVINKNAQEMQNRIPTHKNVAWRSYGLENIGLYESMAGVKYYLRQENQEFPQNYELVEEVDFYGVKWQVYRNPDALPLVYAFPIDYYREHLEKSYYEIDQEILERALPASQVTVGCNRISATIEIEEESCLILAVPYSPGWKCLVNGQEIKTFCSCIQYIAAEVPAGNLQVEFVYQPYFQFS